MFLYTPPRLSKEEQISESQSKDHARPGCGEALAVPDPGHHIIQTFEWDGMPARTAQQTITFEPLGDDRTRITCDVCFSQAARDGMVRSGMDEGMNQSYDALDKVLKRMDQVRSVSLRCNRRASNRRAIGPRRHLHDQF